MKVLIFGHSYVRDLSQLGNRLVNVKELPVHFSYFSYPGFSFSDFLEKPHLLDCLIQEDPDIVVVVLGGNDLKVNVELVQVRENCENFFKLLREKVPRAYLVASQIETRHCETVNRHGSPSKELFKKLAVNFNKWLNKQTFKDKILIVNGDSKLGNCKYFKGDGVHLNSEGLKLYFDLIVDCLSVTPPISKNGH